VSVSYLIERDVARRGLLAPAVRLKATCAASICAQSATRRFPPTAGSILGQ
jgi:hypothetical protein